MALHRTDTLRDSLKQLVDSGTDTNAALNTLISDYARFHAVLAIVGGIFLLIMIGLAIFFWRRFRRAPKAEGRTWTFEKLVYFVFGAFTVMLALLLALIVAANISNVVAPRTGFSGSIGLLGEPKAGSSTAQVQDSFDSWLQTGSSDIPSAVQAKVDERLSWQRPKAIITSVLLIVVAGVCAWAWRRLIRRSRVPGSRWSAADWGLLLLGVGSVGACLTLMLMVMGNTQASVAPISMTLFYG